MHEVGVGNAGAKGCASSVIRMMEHDQVSCSGASNSSRNREGKQERGTAQESRASKEQGTKQGTKPPACSAPSSRCMLPACASKFKFYYFNTVLDVTAVTAVTALDGSVLEFVLHCDLSDHGAW